jgi:Na+/proline symporter
VSFKPDLSTRYNFWSGLAGGFFLAMSYFGTDQSQVQRYLSGRSVAESRLGLAFNGLVKVPMQFVILFVGVMIFVFHLFVQPPLFFNTPVLERAAHGEHAAEIAVLQQRYDAAHAERSRAATGYVAALDAGRDAAAAKTALQAADREVARVRGEAVKALTAAVPGASPKDADYMFLGFVLRWFPPGVVGLLLAVILCAAMGATASELSALASTTMVDLWKRARREGPAQTPAAQARDVRLSKWFTAAWGVVAIGFAAFASMLDNLIEAVNILGSIFYGTVLGMFVVAFFLKRVSGTPVLAGAAVAQVVVTSLYFTTDLGFLWFNVIGCALVVAVAVPLEELRRRRARMAAA